MGCLLVIKKIVVYFIPLFYRNMGLKHTQYFQKYCAKLLSSLLVPSILVCFPDDAPVITILRTFNDEDVQAAIRVVALHDSRGRGFSPVNWSSRPSVWWQEGWLAEETVVASSPLVRLITSLSSPAPVLRDALQWKEDNDGSENVNGLASV